jgi:hypothetical protein
MSTERKRLEQVIQRLEHYVECWKQFNHYFALARSKQFSQEDEEQFLETKSVITQELEMIIADVSGNLPAKEDIHALLSEAPSIRFLSDLNDGGLKSLESQWHKLYITWQAVLGQLKAQHKQMENKGWSLFGRRK